MGCRASLKVGQAEVLASFQQCDSLENHCGLEIAVVLNVKGKQ
jgi:hypothetical protein